MTIVNPKKYIRQGILNSLTSTGRTAYYKRVPKTVSVGESWLLIDSLSQQEFADAKRCFEWLCQFNVICNVRTTQGLPPSTTIDDLEEIVTNAVYNMTVTGGFTTKYVKLINNYEDTIPSDNSEIDRRILTFEIWINKKINP